MRLSCNEIAALAVKAARGAGLPLGHAEDIGRAAVFLAHWGELDILITALEGEHVVRLPEDGRVRNARAAMIGPTAIDLVQAGEGTVTLRDVDAPRLINALVEASPAGVVVSEADGELILALDASRPVEDVPSHEGPVDVPQPVVDALGALAARTYVPATEASRLAGAGAGLTDND